MLTIAACRAGGGPPVPRGGAAAAPPPDRVAGRVVDLATLRPLAGRTVAVGGRRAVTDADGAFVLDGVPARYDAAVVEPDRSSASVYQALRRRDPLFVHRSVGASEGQHIAQLSGTLTGGGALQSGDFVAVAFFAPEGSRVVSPSIPFPGQRPSYPQYGPMRIAWRGADSITGELVALVVPGAMDAHAGAQDRPALAARRQVTLRTGYLTTASVVVDEENCAAAPPPPQRPAPPQQADLALGPVPWRPLIVDADADYLDLLAAHYTWPTLGGELELPAHGPIRRRLGPGPHRVAWEVPDLTALGGGLCVEAASEGATAGACAVARTGAIRLRPLPPPGLTLPAGTPSWNGRPLLGQKTRFSWTPFAGGVVRLEIDAQFPSAEHPRVDLYTADTGAGWPDLGALGVGFPRDFVSYDVVAVGVGPFAALDDAVAPDGLGAASRAERLRAISTRLTVTLSPTGAPPDEQACGDVPNVQCDPPAALCGCGPGCICATPCEMVKAALPSSFARIDRQLALHPGLAAAAGLRCIRDCADLRAFRAAYRRYGREHAGFEANEPLPRTPPPREP